MTYEAQHTAYIALCENTLQEVCNTLLQQGSKVSEAARYSLMNGGKRVRGVLALAVCDMLGTDAKAASCYAAAIEMVHAFSLIHDDLPCMDDDAIRRGKPACHIAYGEATALLAGDLLSLQAFEAIATANRNDASKAAACRALARGAGAKGMIYGQELDLAAENRHVSLEELETVHRHKTGALIHTAATLGVLAAEQPVENHSAVLQYADNIGLVFQILDDILDVTASEAVLGKPIGSDSQQGKNTFVSLVGLDGSKQRAQQLTDAAIQGLQAGYGERSGFLCQLAASLASRMY